MIFQIYSFLREMWFWVSFPLHLVVLTHGTQMLEERNGMFFFTWVPQTVAKRIMLWSNWRKALLVSTWNHLIFFLSSYRELCRRVLLKFGSETDVLGIYCGPLRLLAWEIAKRLNKANVPCDLITGQEKEEVEGAMHKAVTVEMADVVSDYDCAVIDEIQACYLVINKHIVLHSALGGGGLIEKEYPICVLISC